MSSKAKYRFPLYSHCLFLSSHSPAQCWDDFLSTVEVFLQVSKFKSAHYSLCRASRSICMWQPLPSTLQSQVFIVEKTRNPRQIRKNISKELASIINNWMCVVNVCCVFLFLQFYSKNKGSIATTLLKPKQKQGTKSAEVELSKSKSPENICI